MKSKLAHFQLDFLSFAVLPNIIAAKKERIKTLNLQNPSVFVGYTYFYTGFKYVLVGGGGGGGGWGCNRECYCTL